MGALTSDQINNLEKEAELNDGRCSKCSQTIKIYRYKINQSHATFLRAMADAARNSGVNDIDISTLGLSYSVRTQVTKMRLHGFIARVKNRQGAQIPRRWLITHKGYNFLGGNPIASKVVVFNNQVLGHDGEDVTIHQILGEKFDRNAPIYDETPVSSAEARTYDDVRRPQKLMEVDAIYKRRGLSRVLDIGKTYTLAIEKLQVGHPVVITMPEKMTYKDIAAFQKDWRAV